MTVTVHPYHCDGCDSEKQGYPMLHVSDGPVAMRLCAQCYMATMLYLVKLARDAKERP
jgi:hypothetical protein